MDNRIPAVAEEFGRIALTAFRSAGGIDLARRAVTDHTVRTDALAILEDLGIADIEANASIDEFLVAGQLSRVAGRVALPAPTLSQLSSFSVAEGIAVVDRNARRVHAEHGDLGGQWIALNLDGAAYEIGEFVRHPRRLGTFVCAATRGERIKTIDREAAQAAASTFLVLQAWQLLGVGEEAFALTLQHTADRKQFGQPLASFQNTKFRLADVAAELRGLEELAKYTSWAWFERPSDRAVDALALRSVAIETIEGVLKTAHQLHGAIGFSDEHDLPVLTSSAQAGLRLPYSYERTGEELLRLIDKNGIESIFGRGNGELADYQTFPRGASRFHGSPAGLATESAQEEAA